MLSVGELSSPLQKIDTALNATYRIVTRSLKNTPIEKMYLMGDIESPSKEN